MKARNAVEHLLDDATVNLADTSHRDKGWWALDTANPNAWNGTMEILSSSSADALAVQETRIESDATNDAENSARNLGWSMAVNGCGYGDGGEESSGVAVGCRKHIGPSESCSDSILPNSRHGSLRSTLVRYAGAVSTFALDVSTPPLASTIS